MAIFYAIPTPIPPAGDPHITWGRWSPVITALLRAERDNDESKMSFEFHPPLTLRQKKGLRWATAYRGRTMRIRNLMEGKVIVGTACWLGKPVRGFKKEDSRERARVARAAGKPWQ